MKVITRKSKDDIRPRSFFVIFGALNILDGLLTVLSFGEIQPAFTIDYVHRNLKKIAKERRARN